MHVDKILRVPEISNSTTNELYQQSLRSSMTCMLSARVAEIWEYDQNYSINVVARLGLKFKFQKLCTPRRLLEIPMHRRYLFWEHVRTQASFPMPHANEIIVAPFGCHQSDVSSRHLLVVTCAPGEVDSKDVICLREMSIALAAATQRMRFREMRASARKQTLQHASLLCDNHLASASALKSGAMTLIKHCFPSSNVYLGFLQAGGDNIRIQSQSECRSHHSLIFKCLPPTSLGNIVISDPAKHKPKLFQCDTRVQVQYGKLWYAATIQKDRGHLKYDITYDLKDWMGRHELEAGVPVARLQHAPTECPRAISGAVATIIQTDDDPWPILIAPIGQHLGIICVDSWSKKNPEADHDELKVVKLLESISWQMGLALHEKNAFALCDS